MRNSFTAQPSRVGGLVMVLTGTRILFQNGIGFGGPFEGLRLCVALSYPSLNRGFEMSDALEHSATDALACDLGEQPLRVTRPTTERPTFMLSPAPDIERSLVLGSVEPETGIGEAFDVRASDEAAATAPLCARPRRPRNSATGIDPKPTSGVAGRRVDCQTFRQCRVT
jgi:hypothetical protein